MMTKNRSASATKSAIIVSSIIVLVKLLGFVKQAVIAFYLGASAETDAFFLVNTVISGISQAVFSAVSVSMIPMYLQKKEKLGKDGSDSFANSVLTVFGLFALILTLMFVVFSSAFSFVFGMNLERERITFLSLYFRQEAIICMCYGLITIMGAILEAEKSFVPLRLNGIFISLTMITLLIVSKNRSASTLVYATILSNVIEVMYMYLCARRFFHFSIQKVNVSSTFPLIRLTIPLFLGNAVIQINSMIDKVIATSVSEGGVTCLNYGQVLYDFVNATLIVSLSSIAYSFFAGAIAKDDKAKMINYLQRSLSYLIIALLPVSIYSLAEARDIVLVIYGRGEFSLQNISDCSRALLGYSVGFVFIAVREILVKAHYAFQDTKKPMINGMIAVAVNILLSITLSRFFGLLGITVSTSIAAIVSMYLSNRTLRKYHVQEAKIWNKGFLAKIVICGGILLSVSYGSSMLLKNAEPLVRMTIVLFVVFSVYCLMLSILKVKEFTEMRSRFFNVIKNKINGKDKKQIKE